MRRRLQKFLPIVLVALVVQILAPIAACWAAGIAATDPSGSALGSALGSAFICHDNAASPPAQSDQGADRRGPNGACAICCIAQAATAIDTPQQVAVTAPYRQPALVVWRDQAPDLPGARGEFSAQARAPPQLT
jgi:DUF2946 family protein